MAVSSAMFGKNTTKNILHAKTLIANGMNVRQTCSFQKNGMMHCRLWTRTRIFSRQLHMDPTKRKLRWVTVGPTEELSRSVALMNDLKHRTFSQSPKQHNFGGSIWFKKWPPAPSLDAFAAVLYSGLHKDDCGRKKLAGTCHQRQNKTTGSSTKLLYQCESIRYFSRRSMRPDDRDDDDGDDEERKRRLRGAVMYVSNPMTWISKQWNLAKLRRRLDPSFSENDFLHGATQAVSYVSQMVSSGQFDQLSGLVIEEVIDWLMSFRNSLAATEREALSLSPDDVVLMKIRYVHLDSNQDNTVAFVDSVCFGLRLCDRVPYLVDLGLRFKRDYSTDPPSDWQVAGVSHIRLQNLATD